MKRLFVVLIIFLSAETVKSQEIVRDPDPRKDYANVFWKQEYTLFDLITDKPIKYTIINGEKVFEIYYSSNENPVPLKGYFTADELENHLYYKFKNKRTCKKFCKSKKKNPK
jgi:hypothetical protein